MAELPPDIRCQVDKALLKKYQHIESFLTTWAAQGNSVEDLTMVEEGDFWNNRVRIRVGDGSVIYDHRFKVELKGV